MLTIWCSRKSQAACIYKSMQTCAGVRRCALGSRGKKVLWRNRKCPNKAIRFIKNIKGQHEVTEGHNKIWLQTLQDKRKTTESYYYWEYSQMNETRHNFRSTAYDEIVNSRALLTMTTCSKERRTFLYICLIASVPQQFLTKKYPWPQDRGNTLPR